MEAAGAAASLVTIVAAALQSTKKVYETVSGIKQAPQHVSQLSLAVQNLQSVLSQLLNCRAIKNAEASTNLVAMSNAIKACSKDVLRFEKELGKLRICTSDKVVGKTWKMIQIAVREKDFRQMWVQVNHHVTSLTIQLNIMQS